MTKVTAAVIERDGRVLLARRAPGSALEGFWEFPGGKIEDGKSPEQCLERELREEFGIESNVGEHIVSHVHTYPHITIELMSYCVDHVSGEFTLTDHDRVDWVDPADFHRYKVAPADLPTVEAITARGGNHEV